MNKVNQIFASLQKGSFHSCVIVSPAKVYKEFENDGLKKVLIVNLRVGVKYDNLKSTKANRESGDAPAENAGLVWGQWEHFPYQIGHKGKTYSRVYFKSCKVRYLWGKTLMKKDSLIESMLKKTSPMKKGNETFTVTSENVVSIKHKGKELLAV